MTALEALKARHPDKSDAWLEGYLRAGTSCPNPQCVEATRQAQAELEELL